MGPFTFPDTAIKLFYIWVFMLVSIDLVSLSCAYCLYAGGRAETSRRTLHQLHCQGNTQHNRFIMMIVKMAPI